MKFLVLVYSCMLLCNVFWFFFDFIVFNIDIFVNKFCDNKFFLMLL